MDTDLPPLSRATWWSWGRERTRWWICEARHWRRWGKVHRSRSHPPPAPSHSPYEPDNGRKRRQESSSETKHSMRQHTPTVHKQASICRQAGCRLWCPHIHIFSGMARSKTLDLYHFNVGQTFRSEHKKNSYSPTDTSNCSIGIDIIHEKDVSSHPNLLNSRLKTLGDTCTSCWEPMPWSVLFRKLVTAVWHSGASKLVLEMF